MLGIHELMTCLGHVLTFYFHAPHPPLPSQILFLTPMPPSPQTTRTIATSLPPSQERMYGWKKRGAKAQRTGSLGLLPLPPPLHPSTSLSPGSLTEVKVDLVVRAGSGLGLRLQANLSAFRTSLLSTT